MHLAAASGHTAAVQLLLDEGAELEAENDNGYTALDLAEENGRTEVASLLREAFDKIESQRVRDEEMGNDRDDE